MKKFAIIIAVIAAMFIITAHSPKANAFDEADATFLGSAIWTDENGITHTSDGLCWGEDGIVFYESDLVVIEDVITALSAAPGADVASDIGSAIWMDANGITHTSDGLMWGPDGIVYYEGTDEIAIRDLGPAIYLDGNGWFHTSDGKTWKADESEMPSAFCYDHSKKLTVSDESIAITGTPLWVDGAGNVHDSGRTVYVSVYAVNGCYCISTNGSTDVNFGCDTFMVVNYMFETGEIMVQVLSADTCEELLVIVITVDADSLATVSL